MRTKWKFIICFVIAFIIGFILMHLLLLFVSASVVSVVSRDAMVNQIFSINITCNPTEPIKGYEMRIVFNQSMLRCNAVEDGTFFLPYDSFISPHHGLIGNGNGTIRNIYEFIIGEGNVTGDGLLFALNFTALENGTSEISLENVGLVNETAYVPVSIESGTVSVQGVWSEPPKGRSPIIISVPDTQKAGSDSLASATSSLITVLVVSFVAIVLFGRFIL